MVDIIVVAIVFILVALCVAKMIQNVKNGRSIGGCDGDCSHCGSAKKARVHKKAKCDCK